MQLNLIDSRYSPGAFDLCTQMRGLEIAYADGADASLRQEAFTGLPAC